MMLLTMIPWTISLQICIFSISIVLSQNSSDSSSSITMPTATNDFTTSTNEFTKDTQSEGSGDTTLSTSSLTSTMRENVSITDTSTNNSTPTTATEEHNNSTWKMMETTKTDVSSSITPTQDQPDSTGNDNSTKIGIAVFVFVLLLIGVVALVVYLYKKQRAGNRGDVQNLEKRNRKSGAFVPDYTGDDDADERYVLDPVGSENSKPIIKGGVLDNSNDSTEVKLETVG